MAPRVFAEERRDRAVCIETMCFCLSNPCPRLEAALDVILLLPNGNVEKDDSLALWTLLPVFPVSKTLVHSVEAMALNLDDVVLLQVRHGLGTPYLLHLFRNRVQEVLQIVVFLQLVLG